MKPDGDPMQEAPRCTARSKRTGLPCCNYPVRGWKVCRMHGARGGGKPGRLNPAYRHGGRTKEAVAMRKMVAELTRESREAANALATPAVLSDR